MKMKDITPLRLLMDLSVHNRDLPEAALFCVSVRQQAVKVDKVCSGSVLDLI